MGHPQEKSSRQKALWEANSEFPGVGEGPGTQRQAGSQCSQHRAAPRTMRGTERPGHTLGKSLEANAAYQVLPLPANAELCLCASFPLSACHPSLLIGSPTQLLSFNLLSSRQDPGPKSSHGERHAERASLLARPTRPSHQHNASAPAGVPTGTLGTTRYLSDWEGGPGTHIPTLYLPTASPNMAVCAALPSPSSQAQELF